VRKSQGICRKFGNGSRHIVIWGDSHAEVLAQVIRPIDGTTIYLLSHLGCPPLAGIARVDGKGSCGKPEILEGYFDYVRSRHPDTVVMLARWSLYIYGWRRYGELQPISYFLTDGRPVADAAASADSVRNVLDATIRGLKRSSRVLVVSQPPDLQALSDRSQVFLSTIPADSIVRWQEGEVSLLREAARREGAAFLDPKPLFCDQQICRLRTPDGYRNFNDDNHLSPVGLEQLWGRIATIVAGSPAQD
jgi:hypothetical protein